MIAPDGSVETTNSCSAADVFVIVLTPSENENAMTEAATSNAFKFAASGLTNVSVPVTESDKVYGGFTKVKGVPV
jgi:hypothetical protein